MTLGRAWGEGTCATGMGGLTALSASAQTGAHKEHLISGKAFQHSKWCRMRSPVTLHPGTRQLSPLQSATCLSCRDTFAQPGTLHCGAFAWPLAAGQDNAWRMSLRRDRVRSMYKFSSRPLAISAATAMASWASSSSEEGGAAASRGRGASMLACCAAAAGAPTLGVCYDDEGADAGAAVFRLLRWRQARGAAARVTAARWGRGAVEAAEWQTIKRRLRFWCSRARCSPFSLSSIVTRPVRSMRGARETSGRRDRLGRVRVDGAAPGEDFCSRAAAATRQQLQRLSDAIDAQAWRDVRRRRVRSVYHNK
jgi:hypothetical protein